MIFNIRDYGAVGDGLTDDSAAFQAALDDAAGVGRVLLENGSFLMKSDPLAPSRSNIKGENATILVTRKGRAAGIALNPGTENVLVSGLEFKGPWFGVDSASYVGGGDLVAWYAEYAENIAIDIRGRWHQREVLAYTKARMESLTDESRHITVKGCVIEGFGQSGILADQVAGFYAERNEIHRNGRDGIRTYGVVGGIIEKNSIGDMFAAYADGDAPNFNVYGVATTRLYGKSGYEDPNLTIGRPSQDIKINKNFIRGMHTWKGLDTHGGVSIQFTDNVVENCNIGIGLDKGGYTTVHGIAPARDITISGNTFRQTKDSRYMRAAITVYGHDASDNQLLDGVTITGNSFNDWGGGTADSCISVSNARGVVVGDNRFKNPRLSAVRFSGRVEGFTCGGNTINNPIGYCTLAVSNGGANYTSPPMVTVSGGGGSGMRIAAKVSAGAVSGLKMLHPGWGYTSAPTLTISGGGGAGALANAVYHAPFGVQVSSGEVSGVVGVNYFDGLSEYESIRLSTPSAGYGVSVTADIVLSGRALPPRPANLASGTTLSASKAWANVSLTAANSTLRSAMGISSVARTSKGSARLTLSSPLASNTTATSVASILGGVTGSIAVSVATQTEIDVTVVDAWGAPLDASFYISIFGY